MRHYKSLKEVDEYLREQGLQLVVHDVDVVIDQRIVGQRYEIEITASGFCTTPVTFDGIKDNGEET